MTIEPSIPLAPTKFVNTLVCEIPHGPIDPTIPTTPTHIGVHDDGSTHFVCEYHFSTVSHINTNWRKL